MKKKIKLIGIIAVIAIIGLGMAACNDSGGSGGNGNGGNNGGGGGGGGSGKSESKESTADTEGKFQIGYNGVEDMTVTVTTDLPAPNNSFTMTKIGDTRNISELSPNQKVKVTVSASANFISITPYEGGVGFQVAKN